MVREHQVYNEVNKHVYWKTPLLAFLYFRKPHFGYHSYFLSTLKTVSEYSFQNQNIFRRKHTNSKKNQDFFQSDFKFLVNFTLLVNSKFEEVCLSSSDSAYVCIYAHFKCLKHECGRFLTRNTATTTILFRTTQWFSLHSNVIHTQSIILASHFTLKACMQVLKISSRVLYLLQQGFLES